MPTSIYSAIAGDINLVVMLDVSTVMSNKNPTKKCLQQATTKIPRKSSKNHQKEKRERQQERLRNHTKPSIHTMKDSYKV
jgi:hypothetical protein